MSSYTVKTNVTNHPEGTFLQLITNLVIRGGVFNLDTDFVPSERAAGANMSVDVSLGYMYLERDSLARPVWSDATENVPINNNTSGNPRITTLVKRVDLTNTPASDGQAADIVDIIAVDGTPAASPVAPTTSAIEAALGTSDPYEILCDVLVADQATAIQDAQITDRRRLVLMRQPDPIETLIYAASVDIDFSQSSQFVLTLAGNPTLTAPTNMQIGDKMTISFIQNATGGYSPTWFSGITWVSPDTSLNTDPNKRSTFVIRKIGTSAYEGYLAGKEY